MHRHWVDTLLEDFSIINGERGQLRRYLILIRLHLIIDKQSAFHQRQIKSIWNCLNENHRPRTTDKSSQSIRRANCAPSNPFEEKFSHWKIIKECIKEVLRVLKIRCKWIIGALQYNVSAFQCFNVTLVWANYVIKMKLFIMQIKFAKQWKNCN